MSLSQRLKDALRSSLGQPESADELESLLNAANSIGTSEIEDGSITEDKLETGLLDNGSQEQTIYNSGSILCDELLNLVSPGGANGAAESTEVTFAADTAGNKNSKYWLLKSAGDVIAYYIWYSINGTGVDPAVVASTGIKVPLNSGDTAATVAENTKRYIERFASSDFSITIASNKLTITNTAVGATTNAANSGGASPGFTYSVLTAGSNIVPGATTTSAVTAIAAGQLGQMLVLVNDGINNLVIKNGAGTKLPAAGDLTLEPLDSASFVYDGSNWITTSVSLNA